MVEGQVITGIISASAAVAAAIIGPYVAYKIATRSIKLTADANERREWVNQFRDDIAVFLTKAALLREKIDRPASNTVSDDEARQMVVDLNVLVNKIGLRLDATIPIHLSVLNLIDEIRTVCGRSNDGLSVVKVTNLCLTAKDQARHLIFDELDKLRGEETYRVIPIYRKKLNRVEEAPLIIER